MAFLINKFFGGGNGTAGAAVAESAAGRQEVSANVDKQIAALQRSKLIGGGSLFSAFDKFGRITVSPNAARTSLVGGLSKSLSATAGRFRTLGEKVRPGFSEFRKAGLQNLRGQRRRVVGDLRENLARRRVAGSSFASDAISRAEAEFQQREDEFTSQTFLQEIDTQAKLIQTESEFARAAIETTLAELNLETEVALQLTGLANSGLSQLGAAQTSALSSLSQTSARALFESAESKVGFQREVLGAGLGFATGGF